MRPNTLFNNTDAKLHSMSVERHSSRVHLFDDLFTWCRPAICKRPCVASGLCGVCVCMCVWGGETRGGKMLRFHHDLLNRRLLSLLEATTVAGGLQVEVKSRFICQM